ncbi:MAG: hypothetical protein D6763_12280 [Alphaproteobacteria bacterium]|nr:MAG: hypothetical protein D6763_12280 [Alphaproteobacteria bacterium]
MIARCMMVAVAILLTSPLRAENTFPGLYPANPALSAADIIRETYAAAGGESWRRPKTLRMDGYAVMYRDGAPVLYDAYTMLRVYDWKKDAAHAADGKVRIEAFREGKRVFLIAFDGKTTYDMNGPIADPAANAQWASNFGFGAIRHALDEGWSQKRLPDDLVDGRPVYMIELVDPSASVTRFGIDQETYQVLYVGFDTPRGWHERRYSHFFTRPGVDWVQPGRVRLFYNGVKQNEVIWTDFELNAALPESLFKVEPPRSDP